MPVQHGCQVEADPPAAAEHDPAHPAGNNAQIAQQSRQVLSRGSHENAVAFPEDKVAVGRNGRAVSQNRADQHPATRNAVHIAERHIAQLAGCVNPQLHDLRAAFGKGIPLEKAGVLQQVGNLLSRLLFRIDGHGQAEHIFHGVDLFGIFRVPDSGDGVQLRVETVGCSAAQQVDGVSVCRRDQQLRLPDTGLLQNVHGRAVAGNRHHIVLLLRFFQHIGIGINQSDVMAFRRQQPRQRRANLSVTGNDYVHNNPRF